MKNKKNPYAYGWTYYRSNEPKSSVLNLSGEPDHEILRIYNATDKPPQVAISIQGKKYTLLLRSPEKDENPDLSPGTNVFADLTRAEISSLVSQEIKAAEEGYPENGKATREPRKLSRQEKRKIERDREKYYSRISVVKTIEAAKDEGGTDADY